MTTHAYIEALKLQLSNVGENPLPVVDGPEMFSQNSQSERSYISVHETDMEPDNFNSPKRFDARINVVVTVSVEKAPHDKLNRHIERARGVLDDVYSAIGRTRIDGFQVMRNGWSREESPSASRVIYKIECTIEAVEYEPCQ